MKGQSQHEGGGNNGRGGRQRSLQSHAGSICIWVSSYVTVEPGRLSGHNPC